MKDREKNLTKRFTKCLTLANHLRSERVARIPGHDEEFKYLDKNGSTAHKIYNATSLFRICWVMICKKKRDEKK